MDIDKKVFVNLSNRPFEHSVYNTTNQKAYSYKPDTGFWGAIKKDNGYFSEWDKEYGLDFYQTDSNNVYVTTFVFNPEKVYVLRPSEDEILLEGFNDFVTEKAVNLTAEQKRRLLAEYIKDKKGLQNIEYVLCQIDCDLDMIELERIFGKFDRSTENGPEIFENLAFNMRKAFVENFAGVEVTEAAIDENDPSGYDIISCAEWTAQEFPGYFAQPGFWDVPSVAVFDTSAIDIIDTKILSDKEIKAIEKERDGLEREICL